MSKSIPLPEKGQPMDVSYIYDLAEVLNDLVKEVSSATYNYTTVDTVSSGKQSVKTSEARLIGGYVEVYNNATVTASQEQPFSYTFQSDYKFPPVVTASPINIGNTSSGKNVTVVLTSVTTSRVDGVIRFNSSGDVSIGVNLIILGIPN
jgi:hypothetical protein